MVRNEKIKHYHVCDSMPEGSVIELVNPYFTEPPNWTYFYGASKLSHIGHCPFCGEKLVKKEGAK